MDVNSIRRTAALTAIGALVLVPGRFGSAARRVSR